MRKIFIWIFSILCINYAAWADIATTQQNLSALESQGIANATDPKIRELYDQLKSRIKSYDQVEQEYMNDLRENATAMKDKEQSTENKLLGTVGIGGVGLGAMQMASGMAEQNADAIAEEEMRAYLATFTCRYGNGLSVRGGETNIETPTSPDLSSLYNEYVSLANSIKTRKSALEMAPGIESELILSSASTDLYNNVATGKTDGAFTSLSQAILNPTGSDADEWAEQTDKASQKKNTGLQIAGTALVGSAVADLAINQDAPKERSAEIKAEYENKRQKLESEISDLESQLNTAITANKKKIAEFNELLAQHQKLVATISDCEFCHDEFADYIEHINSLEPITNDFTDVSEIPEIQYDLSTQQSAYDAHVSAAKIEQARAECDQKPGYKWNDTTKTCEETPEELTFDDTETAPIITPVSEKTESDESICPDTGNQAPGLNSSFKRGDSCSYWHVTNGYVTKANKPGAVCGCYATACQAGYTVHNGMCACPRQAFTKESGKNDTTEKCNTQCNKHCNSGLCTFIESLVTDKHCICNPNDFDKNPAPKSAAASQPTTQPDSLDDLHYTHSCLGFGLPTITKRDPKTGKDVTKQWGRKLCFDSVFEDVQVTQLAASTLAKEFLRIHYGMTNVKCFDDDKYIRQDGNDDYMACTSPDATSDQYTGPTYFDFHFDDVFESSDQAQYENTVLGICNIYNNSTECDEYVIPGYDADDYDDDMGPDTETLCSCMMGSNNTARPHPHNKSKKLSEHDSTIYTGSLFGLSGTYNTTKGSVLFQKPEEEVYTTNKITGIDPFYFYSTTNQFRARTAIVDTLYAYVALQLGLTMSDTFRCNSAPNRITDKIDTHSIRGLSDDVLTCYVNDKPVDFVFDDMSESNKTTSDGAYAFMACSAFGGVSDGSQCLNMTDLDCKRIAKVTGQSSIKWENGKCVMPAAQAAIEHMENVQMGVMIGGVIVATVVTVFTAGTGSGSYAVVLAAAGTIGAGMAAVGQQAVINDIHKLIQELDACKEPSCAEQTLKNTLNDAKAYADDMQEVQIHGIDWQLARLLTLLPPESETYKNIQNQGGIQLDANDHQWNNWTDAEVIRMVGEVVGIVDVVAGLFKFVTKASTQLFQQTSKALAKIKSAGKTTTALAKYSDNAADAADDFAKAASKANKATDAAKAGARTGAKATQKISADDLAHATDPNQGFRLVPETLTKNQKAKDIIAKNMHQIDELAETGENVLYINRTHLDGNDIKAIAKRFKDLGYTADFSGGGSTIKFYKSVDNASDAANAAKTAGSATNAATAANQADNFTPVRQRVMDNLASYNAGGKNTAIPKSQLTDAEWARLNDELIQKNVRMVEIINPDNGKTYMKFERITPANPTSASPAGARATPHADDAARAANSVVDDIAHYLNGNTTLQKLHNQNRLVLTNSSTLNGKQYLRISMGKNPDMDEAAQIIDDLQRQGFYVSTNTTETGDAFIGVSRENIFGTWANSSGNWLRKISPINGYEDIFAHAEASYHTPIGYINGKPVRLTPLPTSTKNIATPIHNIAGRAVVVVDVGGRKMPFYVSSGMAGKDALGIASGKWYPIAGIGDSGGWFNKMPDMLNNPIPELDDITAMLEKNFSASRLKTFGLSNPECFGPPPQAAYDIINHEFPGGVVQQLISTGGGSGRMRAEDRLIYKRNIEIVKGMFK